jgi:hypothetical protein
MLFLLAIFFLKEKILKFQKEMILEVFNHQKRGEKKK